MRIDTTLTTNGHQSRLVERLKIFVSRVRFIPARKGIGHASVRVETAEALSQELERALKRSRSQPDDRDGYQ